MPELNDRQFSQWTTLLEERTGMVLPIERRSFLATSLSMRMREIGYQDHESYYQFLHSGSQGTVEWTTLVDRLTVHETRFFRHPESLDYIRDHFLPRRLSNDDKPYSVQIWSLGCATGEESYSLAMVVDEHLRSLGGNYYFGVTGTDISLDSLAIARSGEYNQLRLSNVPDAIKSRYFEPAGEMRYRVVDELKQRACFAKLNVMDIETAPLGAMDIIYCQNVLIYFDRPRRFEILNNAIRCLAPGGLLVLGAGEALGWEPEGLERISHPRILAYRRLAEQQISEDCA